MKYLIKIFTLITSFIKSIKINYPIAKNTWFGSGGKTSIFFEAQSIISLKFFLSLLPINIPIFTIGMGSNILIRDGGIRGVTIKLKGNFNKIIIDKSNKILKVGSGVKNIDLAKFCEVNNIGGFEFLIGIPGSVGGSVKMNAGCFKQSISDLITKITVIDRLGKIHTINKEKINFSYRKTEIPNQHIIIDSTFNIKKKSKTLIKNKMKSISLKRKTVQPTNTRTGGSTFKNTKSFKAWELIEKINFRGKSLGGAKISKLHPNFIINYNNAKSLDIEVLGEEIVEEVMKKTGIRLEWEIKRVGNFEKF